MNQAIRGATSVLFIAALFAGCGVDPGTKQNSDASSGGGGEGGTQASSSSSSSNGSSSNGSSSSSSGGQVGDCSSLPLCENFDSGMLDAALWTVGAPNCSGTGMASVDGTQAHSGQYSVRVDGKGGYCNHVFITHAAAFQTLGDVVYGRFYLRTDVAQGDGHTTFLAMKDTADNNKDLRMGGQNKILMWNRESDDATLPSLSPVGVSMSVALAPLQWHCVEFQVDGAAGQLRTWVNGNEVAGLVIDGMPTPDVDQQWIQSKPGWKPNLTDLKLGWESYAGQDMTLWFDDVALADTRIGCN